jgi:hypothetical protein
MNSLSDPLWQELRAGKRGNPIKDADINEWTLLFQNTFWQSTHLSRRDQMPL